MASFKIGREFFAKAKADYADWRWSWVREICAEQHGLRLQPHRRHHRAGRCEHPDSGQQRWPAHELWTFSSTSS